MKRPEVQDFPVLLLLTDAGLGSTIFGGESAFRAVGKEAPWYHGPHDPRVTMKILIQWCLTLRNPCPKI